MRYLNLRRSNHAEVQLAKWSVAIPVGIKKKKKHKRTSYMHTEYVHKVFQNCMWGIVLYSECLTDASYLYLTTDNTSLMFILALDLEQRYRHCIVKFSDFIFQHAGTDFYLP